MRIRPLRSIMSSAELLCDRLAELVAGEREQVLTDIAAVLRELAVELRDGTYDYCTGSRLGDVRITLCRTGLPASITRALAAIHEPINRQFLSLAEQAGRSAANLAADCDPGRDVLLDAEYVAECSRVIALCTECVDEALLAVKALVASLLNLVVEGHGEWKRDAADGRARGRGRSTNDSGALFPVREVDGAG